ATGTSSVMLAYDLVGVGRCHLAMKAPEKALAPLERAVALREKSDEQAELAEARFELARALWDGTPEAHDRSRQLAAQAREALHGAAQADVDKWLASRETKPPSPP